MKRLSVPVGFAIALFFLFFHAAWAQEVKKPKLVIKEALFNAGELDEGKIIKHTFLVSNHGDATLDIKAVRPG